MCGIVGTLGQNKNQNEELVNKMNQAIFHRGPDGAGVYADDRLGLAMRRLAIIDVSGGDQPIWNKDRTKCIFFNGEIYNYQEIRSELLPNYPFQTNSDTETILALYEEVGPNTPKYLRGMFAFTIYDTKKNELFIARDHFGIKPFYYFAKNRKIFSFGSEIKSILEDSRYVRNINHDAIYAYLQYQYNPLEETFFKDIYKLEPGHYMRVDASTGSYVIDQYYKFKFSIDDQMSINGAKEDIKILLNDSVAHHAISDVPVGSFLSGGVDSSINATLLTNNLKKPVHTFTIGSNKINEFAGANETVNKIQSLHHEVVINREEYMNSLGKAVYHFDEPVADPSAILLYLIAKEARKNVTVVLSGEGADEFFGGYTIYHEYYDRRKLNIVPKFIREHILRRLAFNKFQFYGKNYLKRYFTPLANRYIGNARIYEKSDLAIIWNGPKVDNEYDIAKLYNQAKYYTEPTQMQYVDINTWLVGDILAKADKMTMAHSLELRVPFLDVRVAEYAKHLPDKLKFASSTTKYALREAFKGLIPSGANKRRKLGFPTELRDWLKSDISMFKDELENNKLINQYIKKTEIQKLINNHTSGKNDESRKLFALYTLALWHNTFFK